MIRVCSVYSSICYLFWVNYSYKVTPRKNSWSDHKSVGWPNFQDSPKVSSLDFCSFGGRKKMKTYVPRYEKTGFSHMRKQRRRSAQLISAFVFAIRIVQALFYLIPKFQASSHLLWQHSPVCVGPGPKS